MNLRVARHSKDIRTLSKFYVDILGMNILGSFEDHDGYNGIFLGFKNADWHLEFTESGDAPNQTTDEDDSLVFYPETENQYNNILGRIEENKIEKLEPKNPYWKLNGITIADPDGFIIIISPLRIG